MHREKKMVKTIKATSSPSQPKALDVIAPGKSAPSSSSRPIIVTNRPMIKDPMAPLEQPTDMPATDKASLAVHTVSSTVLAPQGESPRADEAADVGMASTAHETLPNDTTRTATGSEVASTADSISDTKDASGAAELQGKMSTDGVAGKVAHEEAARTMIVAQEKVIATKQYYLPIRATDKQRDVRRAVLVLLLVVVISFVWIDLLLDAGIVRLGTVHSLTHFFSA